MFFVHSNIITTKSIPYEQLKRKETERRKIVVKREGIAASAMRIFDDPNKINAKGNRAQEKKRGKV